jgi:flagellar FliL protein
MGNFAGEPRRQAGLSTVVLVILILVAVLLLGGGGTVAALYFGGVIGGDSAPTANADAAGADAQGGDAQAKAEKKKPPIYLPIEPALVANFDRKGRVGYLQAGVELMAREQKTIDAAQKNMPVIRNNLLFLMSSKSYEELSDRAGKEKLREQALGEVNKVLEEQGFDGRIEAVYFTAFVMQ